MWRRSQWPRDLRRRCHCDGGLESRRRHGCLSLVSAVCYVEIPAMGRSLVQRSPTGCVFVCVCVCVSLNLIKCNNKPSTPTVRRKVRIRQKERKKEKKKENERKRNFVADQILDRATIVLLVDSPVVLKTTLVTHEMTDEPNNKLSNKLVELHPIKVISNYSLFRN